MKRVSIDQLNDIECETMFNSLDLTVKHKLLKAVATNYSFNDTAVFRDVVPIIASYVDLQTWGRLRQASKTFSIALKTFQPLHVLQQLYELVTRDEIETSHWISNLKRQRSTCESLFNSCAAHIIQYAHTLMNNYTKTERNSQRAQEMVQLYNNTNRYNERTNSNLEKQLDILSSDICRVKQNMYTYWIYLPFFGLKIYYPYGYVCNKNTGKTYFNIFEEPERWMPLIHVVDKYRFLCIEIVLYKGMSKQQRVDFKIRNKQWQDLYRVCMIT